MVGLSLEESTISESSLGASTAPTTLTGRSTFNLSHDFLPRPQNPTHTERTRKERSSPTLTESESLTQDLSLLLRSNSRLKCDPYTGSQTVLRPLPEELKDRSDYAHTLSRNSTNLSKLDLESRMLRQRDTDKVKRSENKFYGFLRRGRLASRSAPKKRRSRSADEITKMDQAMQSTLSLTNDAQSVRGRASRFLSPPIKRGPISPSPRPLSTTSNKQLPQLPPGTKTSTPHPAMHSTHVMREPEHPKPRKKTFFGMITLPSSRRSSISKSRPTTPHSSTPDNSLNPRHLPKPDLPVPPTPKRRDLVSTPLNDATNYRWNGDVAGQRSQPSFDISEPDSGLGIETIVAKTKLVTIVSPRSHLGSVPDVPVRPSSTPPRIGNGVDKSRRVSVDEANRLRLPNPTTSGRVSPLMAFTNSKVFGGKKGKERESGPDRTNDIRKATPTPTPENQKGRDSQNSKPISGPLNIKTTRGRVKHGSFDFERPLSTSAGYPVRTARWSSSGSCSASNESERNANSRGNGHLWNNPNPSTYPIQEERSTLTRSLSARGPERGQPKIRFTDEAKVTRARNHTTHDARSRTQLQPQHTSQPPRSAGRGPVSPKNGNPIPNQTILPYRPEGGSWGRRTLQRPGLGGMGHTNDLPSFGMSASSLQQGRDATGLFPRSNPPQVVTLPMDRHGRGTKWHTGKGRSLDLGLELNWAPTRVREEAVMDFREMGVRSKWREEAEMKESHRMEVLESFERALDESAYAKFKEYVQRFHSRLMPSEGPSGLVNKTRRLLDTSARGLDDKRRQELLQMLDCLVQHPR